MARSLGFVTKSQTDPMAETRVQDQDVESIAIPLVHAAIESDDVACLVEAARQGLITQGERAGELEAAFSGLYSLSGGSVTSSGTAALHLALRALDIGPGAEVIIPSYTCLAVLHAVLYVGATPVLVDNHLDVPKADFNMDSSEVAARVTTRTGAVIVPHMFGCAADMDGITRLQVPIVEDITLSVGCRFGGRPIGTFGDLVACSLHASKMIAAGEGGILLAREPSLADKVQRINGWADEQAAARWQEPGRFVYEESYNYRMSDIHATLALNQLRKLEAFALRRQEIARRYTQAFRGLPGIVVPEVKGDGSCIFFRYMVSVGNRDVRSVLERFRACGIEAGRGVFPALHHFMQKSSQLFANAERAIGSMVSIPLYPALSDDQVEYIIDSTISVFRETAPG